MRTPMQWSRQVDTHADANRPVPPLWWQILRLTAPGCVLAFAMGNAFAATARTPCERMAENLTQMEQRSYHPSMLARAQARYERMCRSSAAGRTADTQQPAVNHQAAPQASAQISSPPAPETSFARIKTDGHFADWDRELSSQCDNGTANGRTRCAQLKIDRAVKEGRLSASEVEACLPAGHQTDSSRQGSAAQRELQSRRLGSLGGDAFWKWSATGSCKLVERVQQTFAAVTPPAHKPMQTATACALDTDGPQCRAATEPPQQRRFSQWSAVEHGRCARESTPGQNRERDYCARTVVERAGDLGLISATAIDHCRTQWTQGNKERTEYSAIHLCLENSARLEDVMTSRILRLEPAPVSGASLPAKGYRQSAAVAAIHAGDFSQVPPLNEDGTYFYQALNELGQACPGLGIAAMQMQLIQLTIQRQREMMERAARGQGTREEAQAVAVSIAIGMVMMEDCDAKDSLEERQQCQQGKDNLNTLPESRDAVHDMALLVKRHTCNGNETRRFATNLGRWLMTPPAKRSPLVWAEGSPKQAEYRAMFDHCRRQAGDGAADAWCGCYVEQFSKTRPGTRAHPVEHAATAHATAFVGGHDAWFVPAQLGDCNPLREELKSWRRTRSLETATACLLGQTPVANAVAPSLLACRYRTAWGEIEYRNQQCPPRLTARYWGSEAVPCN